MEGLRRYEQGEIKNKGRYRIQFAVLFPAKKYKGKRSAPLFFKMEARTA